MTKLVLTEKQKERMQTEYARIAGFPVELYFPDHVEYYVMCEEELGMYRIMDTYPTVGHGYSSNRIAWYVLMELRYFTAEVE